MNKKLLSVLAFGGLIALTGCGEEKAATAAVKVEVNNWYCRPDLHGFGLYSAEPSHRISMMEEHHEIVDGQEFFYKCKEQKLGYFSDEYKNLVELEHRDRQADHTSERLALFAKWRKEAGV